MLIRRFLLEMFYLNSTLNFGIPPVLVFQLEVYYKVDRLLTGLTAQPKGTTARWYSNKTSLFILICYLFTCLMSILFYSKLKAYLSELGVFQKFSFPAFVLSQKFSYTYFWNIFSPKVFHFPKLVLLTFYKVSTSFVVVRSNLLLLILTFPILDQE